MIRKFEFKETSLKGAYIVIPFRADDERGYFIKDYSKPLFETIGISKELREVFYTHSKQGVIRAIHFQSIKPQAKLVRCIKGRVHDVIVDLRPDSPDFGKWEAFELSEDNNLELYVPEGFGHGYHVLEDAIVSYKCSEDFFGLGDDGILYNDLELNIDWKINPNQKIILSEKDRTLQNFEEFRKKNQ